jgi:gluconate 5-dehydrogenase
MISDLFDIKGRVALITGSSKGLGFILARGLGRAGAIPVLNCRSQVGLQKALSELHSEGIEALGYTFDVTDEKAVESAVSQITDEAGGIDILVNNAGIQIRNPLESFSTDDWRNLIDTNLTGVFLVSRAVAGMMIERRNGKIINICSMQSELGRPTITPYAASKGGVRMITKGMATEWGRYNIQVNGIGPGYFITEMTRPLADNKSFDQWLKARTPAGRWGDPEELIGAAIFLASKASDYVNGHILYVDGGLLACV